jgi:hypothetical protein
MGFKLKKTEVLKLAPNEEKELCIELEEEKRAAIHGVVKFPGKVRPVQGALVKLFRKDDCHGHDGHHDNCDLIPVTFAFTDECGQFLFGVDTKHEFVIKVFFFVPEKFVNPCEKDGDCL